MNKKITVKNDQGRMLYCILSDHEDLQSQINRFLFGQVKPSGGYFALLCGDRIDIVDSIAFDRVTSFDILSIEDTDLDLNVSWAAVEE